MSNIDKADIEGFKGLRSISLEFADINIITGRNNSGKSSVLESIELAHNPESIRRYQGSFNSLINVNSEKARILCNSEDYSRELIITRPSKEEVIEYSVAVIDKAFFSNDRSMAFGRPTSNEIVDSDEFDQAYIDSLKSVLNRVSESTINELASEIVVLRIDGNEHPYFYFSDKVTGVLSEISEEIAEAIMEQTDLAEINNHPAEEVKGMIMEFTDHLAFFSRHEGFLLGSPEPIGNLSYVRTAKIDSRGRRNDNEDLSVKKVRVQKYLKSHNILPNLVDFDFDNLVFDEGDGNEYPVSYDFMGDGLKSIVGILWQFIGDDRDQDIVLMEEPENHLHPGLISDLVPFLIQVARDDDIQLFITTHNIDFITEFFNQDDNRVDVEYLEDELRVHQMTEIAPKTFGYNQAQEQINELHMDLRGV